MNRWFKIGTVIAALGLLAVIGIGCSDDDKGSNSSGLTKEQQFDQISEYFSFDPEEPGEFNVTSFVVGMLSSQYWDGVDPEDVGAASIRRGLPLAKFAGVDHDSLYTDYSVVSGWWVVYAQASTNQEGVAIEVTLRDSVRFEDAEGHAQLEPNDSTTARIRVREQRASTFSATTGSLAADAGDHLELGATNAFHVDVTRASASVAQVDGGCQTSLNLTYHSGDTASADIDIGLQASYDQVVVPLPDQAGDACPSGGDVSAGMDISIDVQSGDQSASADGSWDASVSFTGDGNATVDVESGDFSKHFSGQACVPNPNP